MPGRAAPVFEEMKRRMDSVFGFIAERGRILDFVGWEDELNDRATETVVAYEAYRKWCQENGHHPKNMGNFAEALIAYGQGNVEKRRIRRHGRQPWAFVNFELVPFDGGMPDFERRVI
jgi:phage/plasmid-associated DNA primase